MAHQGNDGNIFDEYRIIKINQEQEGQEYFSDIDQQASLKNLIIRGAYDQVDALITEENFPSTHGESLALPMLVCFCKKISPMDAVNNLEKLSLRVVTPRELLRIGFILKVLPRHIFIVAPYERKTFPHLTGEYFPALSISPHRRILRLYHWETILPENTFLCVKNKI